MAHYKMDRIQRAKQFAPFDALRGFAEALRAQERVIVPKVELSEDRKEELDRMMMSLGKNEMVSIIYYSKDSYVKVTGILTKIDLLTRQLSVVDTKIDFSDVRDIVIES